MPWKVVKNGGTCSGSKPWAVIKEDDGSTSGCHASKAEAEKQQAALYAKEDKKSAQPDEENNMTDKEPTRDDLCRSVPFELVRADDTDSDDGLTLEGYAAVFNSPTRIDSWEGTFDETIAPGAFKRSLRSRTPRMQFDHGYHPLIGSIPIGRFTTIEEDTRGLHVVGRLTDNWLIQPVRDAIKDGGIDGMSFRFSVVKEEWRDNKGALVKDDELFQLLWSPGDRGPLQRSLKEVKVTEAGPVVWPAYQDTEVGVRSNKVTIDLGQLTNPAERKKLAEVAFLIDAAVRNTEKVTSSDEPLEEAADERIDPPATENSPDEHAEEAPPVTEGSPDEHSSEEAEAEDERQARQARRERMLAGLRQARSQIADIEQKGYGRG